MSLIEPTVEWISEKLRLERLSQRDLADALGLDPSAVTRLLKGQRRLRPEEVPLVISFFTEKGAVERTTAPRLAIALSLPSVPMSTIAARTGIDGQRLLELKHARGRGPTFEEASALAEVVGMDAAALLSEGPVQTSEKEAMRRASRMSRPAAVARMPGGAAPRRTIPIHAAPLPQGRGEHRGNTPIVEWRTPPEALVDVTGAFGIYIGHDDLSPMLLRGDIVYVHPSRPARIGERVMVRYEGSYLFFGLLAEGHVQISGGRDRQVLELDRTKDASIMPIVAIGF